MRNENTLRFLGQEKEKKNKDGRRNLHLFSSKNNLLFASN